MNGLNTINDHPGDNETNLDVNYKMKTNMNLIITQITNISYIYLKY